MDRGRGSQGKTRLKVKSSGNDQAINIWLARQKPWVIKIFHILGAQASTNLEKIQILKARRINEEP